ncbi:MULTISPECIES: TRAP transporter substrate-binding protein [Vibrio]|uniref:TRAP transporter substrate-binding protein n=1 Tax=Vibrio casei TaxID=673372 RepID=A0A368LI42_9VIBR|nr:MULTISPECIES: TRAP transporter substrate-binding protein [Vibrio]RCS70341.1 TRAP transporter substrate-binding protein [Vibrio casei]SJN20050.1 TRAP-type C4-dicarboxylate transport system, periplasmic component [Vibrio casei]HBV77116.1 TRAP transporter substrate-binding protein [Vibrio sp.]
MKNMKTLLASVVLTSAMTFQAQAATLKLAHALPTEHPVHKSLAWFADEVKKETKIRVKVYPNGTLGDETNLLQMVQNGTIAFTKVSAAPLSTFAADYNVLSLPYLFKDKASYDKVLEGPIGDKILASSEKSGFIGLAFLDAGARSFYTDKPIKEPSDLKGMKIRVQNSPISIDTMKALGATAVPLPYGELYSALQQGVVDGAENNIPSYYSSRHYEVKKFFSYDMHTMVPDVLVVSTATWNPLTDEQKATIRKIAKETVEQQKTNWKAYVDKSLIDLKKQNVTFTDSDIPAFQEAVKPVYEKFKKENPDLADLLEEIQQAQ